METVQFTKTYSYGDSNWKDKLTSYAGITIIYASVGNKFSCRGILLSEDKIRLLAICGAGNRRAYLLRRSAGLRGSSQPLDPLAVQRSAGPFHHARAFSRFDSCLISCINKTTGLSTGRFIDGAGNRS